MTVVTAAAIQQRQAAARSDGEGHIERAVVEAFGRVRALTDDLVRRADASDRLDVVAAVKALPIDAAFAALQTDLASVLASAIEPSVAGAAEEVEKDAKLIDELAQQLALERAVTLVRGLTASTRTVLRRAVADALRENMTVPQLARAVRDHVGLLPRQARVVERLRRELVRQGVAASVVEARVARRTSALIRARAQMIARTEMQIVQNGARFGEWMQRRADGTLGQRVMKRWIGKDPCRVCIELGRAAPIPLTQPFYSATARQSFMHPPAHPNCKCSVGLVFPPTQRR